MEVLGKTNIERQTCFLFFRVQASRGIFRFSYFSVSNFVTGSLDAYAGSGLFAALLYYWAGSGRTAVCDRGGHRHVLDALGLAGYSVTDDAFLAATAAPVAAPVSVDWLGRVLGVPDAVHVGLKTAKRKTKKMFQP